MRNNRSQFGRYLFAIAILLAIVPIIHSHGEAQHEFGQDAEHDAHCVLTIMEKSADLSVEIPTLARDLMEIKNCGSTFSPLFITFAPRDSSSPRAPPTV